MRTDFRSPSLPPLLHDGVLAFFWTDSAAGSRIRTLLQRRHEDLGQSPRGARRIAGLRLLASLGLATLFAPWLVLATALCSRVLVSHGPGVPWASQALLLLSWGLAALYGRGILQLDRSDAWFKSVYRLNGHDLQALPLERTLGLLTPPAAGGVVLQHWRAARR